MKTYTADEELAALIQEAAEAGKPLRVRAGNTSYELNVKPSPKKDIWQDYDPEAAREAWGKAFGSWQGVDAEAMVARIRSWRGQDASDEPDRST